MPQFIVAANWKMYLSSDEEIAFCQKYKGELDALTKRSNSQILLFPSFISLREIGKQLSGTSLMFGAQDCSHEEQGAFTAQVPARSLAQVGCSYTLVGHSERRAFHESAQVLAHKVAQLFSHNISPIICIGETREEYEQGSTTESLTQQLTPYLSIISKFNLPFCVAYEPIWAIGSSTTPQAQELSSVFEHINRMLTTIKQESNGTLLYGGGVNPQLAPTLQTIPLIGGFLVGRTSIDFQEFKKIVLSQKI